MHCISAVDTNEINSVIAKSFYRTETRPAQRQLPMAFTALGTTAGRFPILRLEHGDITVRRQWSHIREHRCDFYNVSFPLSGSVCVTQDLAHDARTSVGEVVITCGDRPHYTRTLAADAKYCSQLHVLVPSHIMRPLIPNVDQLCGRGFDVREGTAKVALSVLRSIVDEVDSLDPHLSDRLTLSAIECLACSIHQQCDSGKQNLDGNGVQFQHVLRYIDRHLSSQGLTAKRVADSCNISRRYLHDLMRKHGTLFSDYLWEQRLLLSEATLRDSAFDHFHIVDVAYMCGFRGASHFSLCYRKRFGKTPSETRNRVSDEAS